MKKILTLLLTSLLVLTSLISVSAEGEDGGASSSLTYSADNISVYENNDNKSIILEKAENANEDEYKKWLTSIKEIEFESNDDNKLNERYGCGLLISDPNNYDKLVLTYDLKVITGFTFTGKINVRIMANGYEDVTKTLEVSSPASCPDDIVIGTDRNGIVIRSSNKAYIEALQNNNSFVGFSKKIFSTGVNNQPNAGQVSGNDISVVTKDGYTTATISYDKFKEIANRVKADDNKYSVTVAAVGYVMKMSGKVELTAVNAIDTKVKDGNLSTSDLKTLDESITKVNQVNEDEGTLDVNALKVTSSETTDNNITTSGMVIGSIYDDLDKFDQSVNVETTIKNISDYSNVSEIESAQKVEILEDKAFSIDTTKTYNNDSASKVEVYETSVPVSISIPKGTIDSIKVNSDEELVVVSKHTDANGKVSYETYEIENNEIKVSEFSDFYFATRKKETTNNNGGTSSSTTTTNTSTPKEETKTTVDTKVYDAKDKNHDGVVTCDEEMNNKNWVWNNTKKACVYRVTNTSVK